MLTAVKWPKTIFLSVALHNSPLQKWEDIPLNKAMIEHITQLKEEGGRRVAMLAQKSVAAEHNKFPKTEGPQITYMSPTLFQ